MSVAVIQMHILQRRTIRLFRRLGHCLRRTNIGAICLPDVSALGVGTERKAAAGFVRDGMAAES